MAQDNVDLDRSNYFGRLSKLLDSLSRADFVALDFELSGIPSRLPGFGTNTGREIQHGRPTVQQRYEEYKRAAEKYQILQVGITIATQSKESESYWLEPYNINLNPCILHRMDIDRDISFLGNTVQFLTSNGFQLDRPFISGVPYLSREEHRQAIQIESSRLEGQNLPDIVLQEHESVHQRFIERVQNQVKNWSPKNKDDSLLIAGNETPGAPSMPLSNLQRRLVHQVVRAEFKDYISVTNQGSMRILVRDAEREEKLKKQKMEGFMQRVSKQTGLRWIMEAMTGGDLTDLDPVDLYMQQGVTWLDLKKARRDLTSLSDELKARRPVLVGHNMFLDLVYMYKTFFGPLPARVGDFAKAIHELFPMIVDTKFLCTDSGNSDNTSLEELTTDLHLQPKPSVQTRLGHCRYEDAKTYHEAGYDSWQTAKLVIKAGAKLVAETNWRQAVNKPTIPGTSRPLPPGTKKPESDDLMEFDSDDSGGVALAEHAKRTKEFISEPNAASADEAPGNMLPVERFHLLPKSVDPEAADPHKLPPRGSSDALPQWLPPWNSEFWLLFGNKIRINGTQENLLDLMAKNEDKSLGTEGVVA